MMSPEHIGLAAGALTSVAFLPQAILTIRTRDTRGLSLGTYGLFTAGVFLWLLYGLHKEDMAIILANSFTFALALPILAIKLHNTARRRNNA